LKRNLEISSLKQILRFPVLAGVDYFFFLDDDDEPLKVAILLLAIIKAIIRRLIITGTTEARVARASLLVGRLK
jgi:hypothetical protein